MLAYSHCIAARKALYTASHNADVVEKNDLIWFPSSVTKYENNAYQTELLDSVNHQKRIGIYVKSDGMWLMISSEVRQLDTQTIIQEENYYFCEPGYRKPLLLSEPYAHNVRKQISQISAP